VKKTLLTAALLAAAFAAQAGGNVRDGNIPPFQLNDGRTIQANMPTSMRNITDYFENQRGATFRSTLVCSATDARGNSIQGGTKLFAFQNGRIGAFEGCGKFRAGGAVVIWGDGSMGMIPVERWEGFIPMYMK